MDIEQPDALRNYLKTNGYIDRNESPNFYILAGGVSNRTVLVERASGEAWVIKQALTHLRTQTEWFSSPERIHREALGIRWLATLTPPGTIPALVFEDRANNILAMRAVPPPLENWKPRLLAGNIKPDHVRQFGELLGMIHCISYNRRDELELIFRDRSFFESLRLDPYYRVTAQQVPAAAPFLNALIDETGCNVLCLVHGDYSPKNILIHHGQIVLLDHEVIHWGDPAFDVGFALTHLLSKAHHVSPHRLEFRWAAHLFWQCYRHTLGDVPWRGDLEARSVRQTLACLLARVDGRSPLEYLVETERVTQRRVVVNLIQAVPETIPALIDHFLDALDHVSHSTTERIRNS